MKDSAVRVFWFSLKNVFINYALKTQARKLADAMLNIEKNNFESRISKLLLHTLTNAQVNVPYYRNLMQNTMLSKRNILSNLKAMPLLTKEIIRAQGEEIYSENFKKEFRYWMNTGGSTGEPLKFPVSVNFEYVHQKCLYYLMGGADNEVIVSVDGSRISDDLLAKNVYWESSAEVFPYGSVHYSTLYMTDITLPYYIDHLNKTKPSIIRGYPSGLEKIGKYLIANNIKLEFSLKGIYLTSEYFDNSNAELIRKAFRCSVFGQYGHSEVSVFAFTAADSLEYMCSPLYGYTEVLNENGEHVNEGETGEIVVTGYSNKVLPFIRYRTGDIAVYGGRVNGIVKLKSLQGRSVDYIINSELKKIFITGLVFGGHLKSFEKIKQWQIEQSKPGIIDIRIVKEDGFSDFHENEIKKLFNSVKVIAGLAYVDHIPLTSRGKRKFLIQNIQETFQA